LQIHDSTLGKDEVGGQKLAQTSTNG
jgi:hypothetical protein